MSFIKNLWYVAAWDHELGRDRPIGRTVIGEPLALYRRADGSVVAVEDRCAHRHAPLSLGRIEGDDLRCMYHGMLFGCDGVCKSVQGGTAPPRNARVRVFPVVERSSWIWVWMGDPALADPASVPHAFGLDGEWIMQSGALDYAADYQLVNDNLCDLNHLDFVHETTLGFATGSKWSNDQPRITALDDGLLIERWHVNQVMVPGQDALVDTWTSYRYLLPGIFLMMTRQFPVGAAAASQFGMPDPALQPLFRRVEQQAVTPSGINRSRYLFASGTERATATPEMLEGMFAVVTAAFAEDRAIIEAQQRIWDQTPPGRAKAYIPQDQGPTLMRRKILERLAGEQRSAAAEGQVRAGVQ